MDVTGAGAGGGSDGSMGAEVEAEVEIKVGVEIEVETEVEGCKLAVWPSAIRAVVFCVCDGSDGETEGEGGGEMKAEVSWLPVASGIPDPVLCAAGRMAGSGARISGPVEAATMGVGAELVASPSGQVLITA